MIVYENKNETYPIQHEEIPSWKEETLFFSKESENHIGDSHHHKKFKNILQKCKRAIE